jgi:DNA-directed RNA polymerase subunit RPC12/RpoP
MRFQLAKAADPSDRSRIFVDHAGPAFFGGGDTTYTCGHCGKPVASLVAADRIWDLVVECGHCQRASEFPRLPPGATATGYVFFPKGRYRITAAIDTSTGALMIGEGAVTGGGTRFKN